MKKSIVCFISGLISGLAFSPNGFAQDKSLFEKKIFVSENGETLPYRILFPENYNKDEIYPLILFLHGSGERGIDNEKQLLHGADLFLNPKNRKDFPSIVIFPQCPVDKYWIDISIRSKLAGKGNLDFEESVKSPSEELTIVNELVEHTLKSEAVDTTKIYLIGMSMGGFGTFETLARWPHRYAAAIGICGGGNISLTKNYAEQTAIWITHGAKDEVVPAYLSQRIYRALKEHGADVRYTEFPEARHNAWDSTFAKPELLPWLFSHHK